MRDISALSDHVIASINASVWSAKVMIGGQPFIFEETVNDIRLVSSGGKATELGVRRNTLVARATLQAREEYARYLTSKEIA